MILKEILRTMRIRKCDPSQTIVTWWQDCCMGREKGDSTRRVRKFYLNIRMEYVERELKICFTKTKNVRKMVIYL